MHKNLLLLTSHSLFLCIYIYFLFFFLWKTTRGRTRVCSTCNTYSRWYYKKKNKIQENPGKSVSLEIKEELKKCLCLMMCFTFMCVFMFVFMWVYFGCIYLSCVFFTRSSNFLLFLLIYLDSTKLSRSGVFFFFLFCVFVSSFHYH